MITSKREKYSPKVEIVAHIQGANRELVKDGTKWNRTGNEDTRTKEGAILGTRVQGGVCLVGHLGYQVKEALRHTDEEGPRA